MTHAEFKVHAGITISNAGGIEIMLDPAGDKLYYRFNYGQSDLEKTTIFESEIEYTIPEDSEEPEPESQPYFTHKYEDGETRYFLTEAMRTHS